MKGTLNKILIFTAGAALGSVVTWKFVKTKYEQIAQEEIDSVKETFSKLHNEGILEDEPEPDCGPELTEEDIERLEYTVRASQYGSPSESMQTYFENRREEVDDVSKPYVIKPEEFDEMAYETDDGETIEYETISLKYFADGVLTDEYDEPIEDVEGMVGHESLTHFGEYEPDSVYVRNDVTKCDYEILLQTEKYSDLVNDDARPAESL